MGARSPLLVSSVLMDADPEGTTRKIKPKEENGKEAEARMTRSGSSKHQRSLTWSAEWCGTSEEEEPKATPEGS